jgi:cobalt-zinc-cadmium efflux system outer membrane protein
MSTIARIRLRTAFALLAAVAPVLGASQTVPPPASAPAAGLAQAVDAAWQRAVAGAEAQGSMLRAEAARAVAQSLLPAAPALEVSHRDGRWAGSAAARETEVAAALPLWLPGQRGARLAAAEADIAVAEAQQRLARWRLAGQVREAGWAVMAAQAEHTQAGSHHASLQRLADDVDRRVRSGDLARADALAARAEALAAQAAQTDAAARLAEAQRRWMLFTGLPPPQAASLAESAPASEHSPPHPELLLAERALDQARRQAQNVRLERRDPPELLLRYRQDADAGSTARQSVGLGVRIPFGTDARNRPLEAQAASALALAERALQAESDRVSADRTQALERLETAQARLHIEQTRHELARERAGLVRKAFDAGEMGLPELLRALAAASAAQSDLERSQVALGAARARLLQSQGVTP